MCASNQEVAGVSPINARSDSAPLGPCERPLTCSCIILGVTLIYIQLCKRVLNLTGNNMGVAGRIGTSTTRNNFTLFHSTQNSVVLRYYPLHGGTQHLIPSCSGCGNMLYQHALLTSLSSVDFFINRLSATYPTTTVIMILPLSARSEVGAHPRQPPHVLTSHDTFNRMQVHHSSYARYTLRGI